MDLKTIQTTDITIFTDNELGEANSLIREQSKKLSAIEEKVKTEIKNRYNNTGITDFGIANVK